MSEDPTDTPSRKSTATEQQFASLAMLQRTLLLHALLAD
jgi:16S rRNA C967 or C1407 C5-methylase (RsmB/RsmF family)